MDCCIGSSASPLPLSVFPSKYFELLASNTIKSETRKKFNNLLGINLVKYSSKFLHILKISRSYSHTDIYIRWLQGFLFIYITYLKCKTEENCLKNFEWHSLATNTYNWKKSCVFLLKQSFLAIQNRIFKPLSWKLTSFLLPVQRWKH